MAKSNKPKTKKVLDEDEGAVEEPVEEEAAEVEADVEADVDVDDVDADIPEEDSDEVEQIKADDDDADIADEPPQDADDDDDDDEESIDEGPPPRRAKLTKLTIALIILNWLVAPAFLYVAYSHHMTRVTHAYRTLVNHVAVWGLPLKSEDDLPSISSETRPVMRLTPAQLKSAFQARPGADKSVRDEFLPVEEPVPVRLRPSDVTDELKRDLFGSDAPVATLDEEITRLKGAVPAEIDKAAARVLENQKDDAKKREAVRRAVFPIVWSVRQIQPPVAVKDHDKGLEDRLMKAKGAELDALVTQAVQRRLYYDILAPIAAYRPGEIKDTKNYKIEKFADLDAVKDSDIKDLFTQQLDAALADKYQGEFDDINGRDRDTIEKRQKIAFILFTIAHVRVPTLDEPLFAKGVERASTVAGFYEFTNASIRYVQALRTLEQRINDAIAADRRGFIAAAKGKVELLRTEGYIDEYEREVDRLVKLVEQIETAQTRLDDLRMQKGEFQKTYDVRFKQHADTLQKLLKARKTTEQLAQDLRDKQQQLHQALVELSDAGERNLRLEAEIRAIEMSYQQKPGKKGAKKAP